MPNCNKPIPFWSWNDKLEIEKLIKQIDWMHANGIGGFFMHARGGLKTEYLSQEWFDCIRACCKRAEELGMDAWAYDENGWPSGFCGGELLKDQENLAQYLTHHIGEYDPNSYVSYSLDDEVLRIVTDGKNCLNIYLHKSISNTDILNPMVVDKFIQLTHERYKSEVLDKGYKLKGFFTDEPQYYRYETPYSPMIEKLFSEKYGYDIKKGLGLLFVEKENYREFRYRYWLGLNSLMVENFGKKIYDWCEKNGLQLTGHYIEERSLDEQMRCTAGCMPLYEYEHIPGIDWLRRIVLDEIGPKQLGSVAAQMDKRLVLTESFAACGWDVTPRELKRVAEFQYVHGVNLLCGHLTPYSEYGQRKRDYPAHFSKVNPWCQKNFAEFNDYFTQLGELLSNSDEIVDVGVLHPMRSTYLVYKRCDEALARAFNAVFSSQMESLADLQISHHYLDETLLEKYGRVVDGILYLGKCKYTYLILPTMYTMSKKTEELLRQFIQTGGKILLLGDRPSYLEGQPHDFGYLKSNITLDKILEKQEYYLTYQGGKIRSAYRQQRDGEVFIYLVNLDEKETAKINISTNLGNVAAVNIVNGEKELVEDAIFLKPFESRILLAAKADAIIKANKKALPLKKDFQIVQSDDNKLTLDFVQYSYDGVEYSQKMPCMGLFQKMLADRYEGDLYLKYTFQVASVPSKIELLAEDMNTVSLSVNGCLVECNRRSLDEKHLWIYNIAKHVKKGENDVVIQIKYKQNKDVYFALFGENVTESLRNCLVYDTNIEPIYLKGDFGVYGNFKNGSREDIYIGTDFYLDNVQRHVTNLITQGYPFFNGNISLEQEIELTNTNYILEIDTRFQAIDVTINGNYAGRLLLQTCLDASKWLKKGKNIIRFDVCISNRNLLGPHHTIEEDCGLASPAIFERPNTWVNGESNLFVNTYAFIKEFLV